ncbi:hypothetical protein [Streptomyces sp. NPDC006551]|uniref:hypothetical protein n=1 Tax=Streptomyces sp. NPDC006551 TaxID=3157178 RepID=UPI0033BC9764
MRNSAVGAMRRGLLCVRVADTSATAAESVPLSDFVSSANYDSDVFDPGGARHGADRFHDRFAPRKDTVRLEAHF